MWNMSMSTHVDVFKQFGTNAFTSGDTEVWSMEQLLFCNDAENAFWSLILIDGIFNYEMQYDFKAKIVGRVMSVKVNSKSVKRE